MWHSQGKNIACAVLSLGRGEADTLVAQRYMRQTISDSPDRDRVVYLDMPVSAESLFRQSLNAI